jgi:transcriptional regulator of acetoin/glycerol metabolism
MRILDMLYDFIDNADFLTAKQAKLSLKYTEFDRLRADRDQYNRRILYRGYKIADGNISLMATGLGMSRNSVYKYLKALFGEDYKKVIMSYTELNIE